MNILPWQISHFENSDPKSERDKLNVAMKTDVVQLWTQGNVLLKNAVSYLRPRFIGPTHFCNTNLGRW